MSQLLPYLGVASLLLVVAALWARQIFLTRKSRIEVILPRERQAAGGSTSHGDLGERIFGLEDWHFVSRSMSSLASEVKLALSYFFFLILCDVLIGWIWLRGPVRTRKMVSRTLRTVAWLRGAFEQLMARIDPATCKTLRTNLDHRAVRG